MGVRQSSVLACALVMLAAASIDIANASVPVFPNNIVAFPQRNFVTLEGYSDYAGQRFIVEVVRGGVVIGSAIGEVSGDDVAFEVNHPGGYCWGAGTGLDVTPDMKHGDRVQLRKADDLESDFFEDVLVMHAECSGKGTISTDPNLVPGSNSAGNVVTIKGVYSGVVDIANTEQRVVNPDLRTTAVARRDVRAVPGPFEVADGYSSKLDFDTSAGTFTATYVFTNDAVLQGAPKTMISGGGERLLSWMFVDEEANRQGITIAELGELGGPGLGGCPQGPSSSAPPAGFYTNASSSDTTAKIMWTPQTAGADAAAVTGYFVSATHLGPADADYLKTGPMKIVKGETAKDCSMPVEKGVDYEFEVRSLSGAGAGDSPYKFSAPFKYQPPAKTQAPVPDGTVGVAPSDLKVMVADTPTDPATHGQITITSLVPAEKGEIYWNIDEAAAVAGSTGIRAKFYAGPFFPPADLVNDGKEHIIHWVVYATVGGQTVETSAIGSSAGFTFPSAGPPPPRSLPTALTYTVLSDGFEANWKYTNADAGLKTFRVEVYNKTTSALLQTISGIPPGDRKVVVKGLPIASAFQFTVIPEPETLGTTPARVDARSAEVVKISIVGATYTADARNGGDLQFTVNSPVQMTIALYGGRNEPVYTTATPLTTLTSAQLLAAVAPAQGFSADVRIRRVPSVSTNPENIWAVYGTDGVGKVNVPVALNTKGRKLRF